MWLWMDKTLHAEPPRSCARDVDPAVYRTPFGLPKFLESENWAGH